MSAERPAETAQVVRPQQGDYAIDESEEPGRMGLVLLVTPRYVQMRELTSGEEWDAAPKNVRKLSSREELSARVAIANFGLRW
ncbi:hypothetical protein AB0M39_41550 [Streptomyces sp. NPDC051907]|uniref:hypothetical protein n=1 Tax=Streptomyces sp. NPDC051907 TaxID=3155284 RepID=UPI00343B37C3